MKLLHTIPVPAYALSALLFPAVLSFAAEPRELPAEVQEAIDNADPQTLMAAGFGLMKLTEDEKARFGEIVKAFGEDVRSAVAKEMRRNAPNRRRRIRRSMTRLFDDLDERVRPIVNEQRLPGYRLFKKGLAEQMRPGQRR